MVFIDGPRSEKEIKKKKSPQTATPLTAAQRGRIRASACSVTRSSRCCCSTWTWESSNDHGLFLVRQYESKAELPALCWHVAVTAVVHEPRLDFSSIVVYIRTLPVSCCPVIGRSVCQSINHDFFFFFNYSSLDSRKRVKWLLGRDGDVSVTVIGEMDEFRSSKLLQNNINNR